MFNGAYNAEGPLFLIADYTGKKFAGNAEDIHHFFSKFLLILVILHIPMGLLYLKATKFYRIYKFIPLFTKKAKSK